MATPEKNKIEGGDDRPRRTDVDEPTAPAVPEGGSDFERLRRPTLPDDAKWLQNTSGTDLYLHDVLLSDNPDDRGSNMIVDEIIAVESIPNRIKQRSMALRNLLNMDSPVHEGFKCLTVLTEPSPAVQTEQPMVKPDPSDPTNSRAIPRDDLEEETPITVPPNVYDERLDALEDREQEMNDRIVERATSSPRRSRGRARRTPNKA